MTKLLRLAAGVLCLGVLALGVIVFDPACLIHFPHGCDPDNKVSVADEVARHEHLNQQEAALRRQRQAKRAVAAEVIARRRSLAEAIEEFRALDREWPKLGPLPHWPADLGMSADEGVGRDVLYFVQLVLADRPDEAATVAGRLEKELQQLLAERKKRLPAPAQQRTEERSR
jgi:hypothetical protein